MGRRFARFSGHPYSLLLLLLLIPAACRNAESPATRLVEVEVTRLVTAQPQTDREEMTRVVVVTATPVPAEARTFTTDQPQTYREVLASGPATLDPALAHDAASIGLIHNVLEPLVYPHPSRANDYLPMLATDWQISEDRLTYTFRIRRDVRFSNGNRLTPGDVAYSIRRFLLASPLGGPQHLLLEPLLGYSSGDITEEIGNGAYVGDRLSLIANASSRQLVAICERVQQAIVPHDTNSTLTFHLVRPSASFLAALSQSWAAALDRQWAVEQGAWDGSCDTWQEWYNMSAAQSPLTAAILGTGPYLLDHWAPEAEYVLVANESYWRPEGDEMWEGGPSGTPSIKTVRVLQVREPQFRWEMLQAGEVETAALTSSEALLAEQLVGAVCDWQTGECAVTARPAGPLRKYPGLPVRQQQALLFNFNVAGADNSYLGSGRLDGNGIPPDFFDDVHVRKAFAHCLSQVGLINAALDGAGTVNDTLLPSFLLENAPEAEQVSYDLQSCSDEMLQAWDNQVAANGFRFQIPFESQNVLQRAVATQLQTNLRAVNPAYHVELIGLPRAVYQQALRERRLPLAVMAWRPALPDPHHWVAPAFALDIGAFQQLPFDLRQPFLDLLEQGSAQTDPAQRQLLYGMLEELHQETLPFIPLPQPTTRQYQQRWVRNWSYNPAHPWPYYYAYALNGQ